MEEIENLEANIKRICVENFSRNTQLAVEHLAEELSCIHETVGTITTEVLRKAVQSWKNVTLSKGESDTKKLIRHLQEAIRVGEIKRLESNHVAKEIERLKREIPERLSMALVLRLSPEVRERYREMELGIDQGTKTKTRVRIKATKEELTELLRMPPGQFAEYEQHVFEPKLREMSQRRLAKYGLTTPSGSSGTGARQEESRTGSRKKEDKARKSAIATHVAVKTVVAPVKYTEKHFREVDRLIRKQYKNIEAYKEVFHKYFSDETGDSLEGFKKAYQRYANQSHKTKGKHV